MDITLTTPALMFPAITLVLLVYTNRFLGLASLIRNLHQRYLESQDTRIREQIDSLNRRVELLRSMQGCPWVCFCVLCSAFSPYSWAYSKRAKPCSPWA